MDAWIPITIAAALAQTLRFMLQRHLKMTALSTAGATYARFVYAAPVVALGVALFASASGQVLPQPPAAFWAFAAAGGLAQILATMCVIALFAERNFAVGLTFKKTEVLQTGLVGYVLLGEALSLGAIVALLIGFAGVVILSDPPRVEAVRSWRRLLNRAAGLGLLAGFLFGISGVGYRGAALSLPSGDVALRAGLTLAVVTAGQTLAMTLWLRWREPGQVREVFRTWRLSGLVGLTSMIGSYFWFSAFTLQTAAYVNAVGQIELLFGLVVSVVVLRERVTARELLGIALLLSGIVALLLAI